MQIHKKDFLLLPNILTYIRILLVPVFVLTYLNAATNKDHIISAVIIVISGVTDVADGFIARHWDLTSDLGRIIDPIADKAMQFAMLICVCIRYRLVILLVIIYAVKELVSFLATAYLFTRGRHISGAMWCGKLCTVILFLVMLSLVAIPRVPFTIVATMVGFAAAFMLLAFFVYMREYFVLWLDYLNELKSPLKTDLYPIDKKSDSAPDPGRISSDR
ncbi:MAG: CDP-alcohol phosphatidyltransferase family protein [Parasporobacterium sp.]|nr:CDP-alcohol phosphatidyltransferase family protein [Parasporobacterium sp.]